MKFCSICETEIFDGGDICVKCDAFAERVSESLWGDNSRYMLVLGAFYQEHIREEFRQPWQDRTLAKDLSFPTDKWDANLKAMLSNWDQNF